MKRLILLAFTLLVLVAIPTQAQDRTPEADITILYYEDENPQGLDIFLLKNNICLEPVLRLNSGLDINNVPYGTRLHVPTNEPCYRSNESGYLLNFSDRQHPRLKYYENGRWLDEPYYSLDVIYTWKDSLEEMARDYEVCIEDLLSENYLLQDFDAYHAYTFFSMDVFIPQDTPRCRFTEAEFSKEIMLTYGELSTLGLVQQYNICIEEITSLGQNGIFHESAYPDNKPITLHLPTDVPPCYDKTGRRLTYYDEQGKTLNEPHYSDLPVYIANPGETIEGIAKSVNVCLVNLLRVNQFPDLPLNSKIELFLPLSEPCPTDTQARLVERSELKAISLETNICPEILLSLNPHFIETWRGWGLWDRIFPSYDLLHWIIIPTNAQPCYQEYHPKIGESIYDVELAFNRCYEEFVGSSYYVERPIIRESTVIYFRHDAPLCYNADGQRLLYPPNYDAFNRYQQSTKPDYSDMFIHRFRSSDSVYSISRQFNVCVRDLLSINPPLRGSRPLNYPVFIPKTRPCYDKKTGMPLIYEDDAGNSLPAPYPADKLIYYGSQPLGRVSYYYNVCMNRIEDANREKISGESQYLGWIIPTDRPPCYDEKGYAIDYICYRDKMHFHFDYSTYKQLISLDADGSYCYDLAQPETVVWYRNQPYEIMNYEENLLFTSRAFTAWCFGVSLHEINAVNNQPEILAILPLYSRAIPKPTRKCYLQNPEILAIHETVHQVQKGETLSSIARQYDRLASSIAAANDLNERNTIWEGQMLIIPDGFSARAAYFMALSFAGLPVYMGLRSWNYRRSKPKKKKRQ